MKIGFLSDIHEDIISLKKALRLLEKKGCTELVCLGDIVGFSVPSFKYLNTRNANECIDTVRFNCSIVIPGNHDLYAVRKTPRFNAGFEYTPNWYDLPFDEREEIADHQIWLYEDHDLSPMLNKKNQLYLESLEEFQKVTFDGIRILFSHYAFPDISGSTTHFIKNEHELKPHFEFMDMNNSLISFSGHRHNEGCIIASPDFFDGYSFEKKVILNDNEKYWVDVPAVASGKKEQGVLIFDTKYLSIETLRIS